jgi:geranylgeranyl diphosphate synthase, type II
VDIAPWIAHNRHNLARHGCCLEDGSAPGRRELVQRKAKNPPDMTSAIKIGGPDLAHYLQDARRRVDRALECCLPRQEDPTGNCPPRLLAAMRYSLMGGGKRLRPILTLMAAEACGSDQEVALPSACAVEMVHTYSLIHDDLPAMDDDDLRRGRPTCHRAFDEATAILAGDALLTLAFEVVARDTRPAEAAVACVRELAEGAGPTGMVSGQMADLEAEGSDDATLEALEAIHRRKTGALLKAALRMGGLSASANAVQMAALDSYGRGVGLAFQIVDDLLDVQGDEQKLGKRVGKDSGLGKWTYPALIGIDGSRRKARQAAEEAIAALSPLGPSGAQLRELALELLERDR